jgi:CheY-like chemotaxis protein
MPKKRILIIDDELDFVKMLRARLQIEGYDVLAAEDGIKGIQIARKETPDLIILDIMMPGMDGYTVCDMLKKSTVTWSIPIIYLTARSTAADELQAYEKGAKYFLTKPYNPPMLLEMVKSALMEGEETGKKAGRILVIDKDYNFAGDCEAQLREAGYDVILAAAAEDGLNAARTRRPDIILLDFQTSHADGHTSIRFLGQDDALRDIPVFILAPQAIMAKVDPKTANLEKFITKPVNFSLLLDTLQRTLKIKKTKE